MKLAICTDVFADLSYTDMLDKVKSLGIDVVEMTAGGWGARKHCNTAELLADAGKREAFMMELEKRGIEHIAIEEFPGTMVWSASTLLKLREATDPMLGINLDPSHMMGYDGDVSLEMEDLTMTVDAGVHTSIDALRQTISR
ncbi:hypothetical protein [Agathobaculum sp.]|uniref:hypothetical protein n=1 Tax=Agathobaculum sp. TaxID=2048138 RepID=UPI003AB73F5C